MFVLDIPPVAFAPELTQSYDERVARLAKGEFRIVYLYERAGDSTFRYRVTNMIQALRYSDKNIAAAYFTENEFGHLANVLDMADVIVVCRARYNGILSSIIIRAQSRGKPVFFDVDDLVFDVRYAHLLLQSIDQDLTDPHVEWGRWFGSISRVGLSLQLCDRVITTNNYLASKIREWANKPVDVIPNFLNNEQLEISRRIFEQKKRSNFKRNGPTCVGYFSGSPTHNKDFSIVASALADALDRDPNLTVRIVGYLDLDAPLRKFKSQIRFTEYVDYINLQRLVGEVEVNLIPLQDNAFCQSKSELKYFEAAIVGTLSIASPIYSFAEAIRDGETGFLASRLEWSDKLQHLLNSMDAYPEMAQCAFDSVESRYACRNQTKLIENVLMGSRLNCKPLVKLPITNNC